MKKLLMLAVLLATAATASAAWIQTRWEGDDMRYVLSPDQNMRLIVRTKPTGKLDVYVDFREQFGQGELVKDGLKTVWVFVWFDDKPYKTQDWPSGVEGRSMFVPDRLVVTYLEKMGTSKSMTVEVLRPLDNKMMRATFQLQ